jgi:hypothetical protein
MRLKVLVSAAAADIARPVCANHNLHQKQAHKPLEALHLDYFLKPAQMEDKDRVTKVDGAEMEVGEYQGLGLNTWS